MNTNQPICGTDYTHVRRKHYYPTGGRGGEGGGGLPLGCRKGTLCQTTAIIPAEAVDMTTFGRSAYELETTMG